MASMNIKNKGHVTGMKTAVPNKDASAGPRLPAWKFHSLLKFWIQNIYWTTPSMEGFQFVTGNLDTSEQVGWGNSLCIWYVIVDEGCIRDCKWPKRTINVCFPMESWMKKKGSSAFWYCVNTPLSYCIFVMSINTTVLNLLIMLANMGLKVPLSAW